MAITKYAPEPGFGTLLGTGLGSGISSGLKALADLKMNEMMERRKEDRFRKKIEGIRQAYDSGVAPRSGIDLLRQQDTGADGTIGTEPIQQPSQQPTQPKQDAQSRESAMQDEIAAATMNPDQYMRYQQSKQQMKQQRDLAQQKMDLSRELSKKKISARKQEQINVETFKSYQKLKDDADAANEQIPLLLEYKRLKNEGAPTAPMFNTIKDSIAKGIFGKDARVDWALGTTEQMQQKLTAQLLPKILKTIKGRPNEFLIREISKGVPNIFTDPVVQEYVANAALFQSYYKAAGIKIADQIMEDNNGNRPRNFDALVRKGLKRAERGLIRAFLPGLTGKLQ